jgi:hypothetical protein
MPLPKGHAVVSTFLSPMERRLYRALCGRGVPAVRVLAQGACRGGTSFPPNVVAISPFPDAITAPSARRAAWCNEWVMRNCVRLVLGFVREGGMLDCLLSDAPPGLPVARL